MQTIFRAISLASFVMSASIIGGGAYVYFQREAILENVKAQVTAHATEAITEALPGLIDGALPALPQTGVADGEVPTTLPAF